MAREMRHSGIEWIGEIPKEWKESKTLYVLSMPITDGPHTTPDLFDNGIPFISADAVSDGFINFDNKRGFISKSFYEECCKKYIPQRDDIYMIKSGASTGQTAIVETDEIFTIWSPLAVFRANKNIMIPRFLLYILRSEGYQKQVENNWSYGTQQNIGMRTLEGLIVSYPNIDEQQKIANYLDKVCGEVDEMIALQEQMIEELKAYKQSVITEAVTKGLNPDVPMRDSGIDWIGEVPEHWEIRRLKYIGVSENGLTYSPKDMCDSSDGGILVLRSSNIKDGKLVFDDNVYVNSAPQILHVKKSDIIICSRNGSAALVGKSAIVEEDMYATFGAFMMRFRSNHNTRYINYLLTAAVTQYKQLFSTTTINQLTKGVFGNLEMPFINSQDEQQSIVSYLDTKCAEIDALIAIKQAKIEELKDYKKSVIYEYVTGKKEVV